MKTDFELEVLAVTDQGHVMIQIDLLECDFNTQQGSCVQEIMEALSEPETGVGENLNLAASSLWSHLQR